MLTLSQQRDLLNSITPARKRAVKSYCRACNMRGEGFMDILKSIGKVLGPIVKEIGPVALKEFILPFLKKKMEGQGLSPAGGSLKLAGQGKMVKGSPAMKVHMANLRAMRKKK